MANLNLEGQIQISYKLQGHVSKKVDLSNSNKPLISYIALFDGCNPAGLKIIFVLTIFLVI